MCIKELPNEFLEEYCKNNNNLRLFKFAGITHLLDRFKTWAVINNYKYEDYFITLAEWRDRQIDEILKEDI